jgi:hypothetical protein
MVPSGIGQALKLAAAFLAFAATAAVPSPVAAAEADGTTDPQRQLSETIQAILSRDGPYSLDLLEPLAALIVLYREQEDDALAAAIIERARQVVRVNEGLHTLEQVPLIRQLIRLEEARGNHAAAWEVEQDLLALVRRYPEDLRTVEVLREVGDRRMEVFERFLARERPPQLYLGCYYGVNCDSGSREVALRRMLADAARNYSDAIAVLVRNAEYDNDELRELELDLLRGADLARTMREGRPGIDGAYYRGGQALRRLYEYGGMGEATDVQQAGALVQMADWELLYSQNARAVDVYERAVAMLQSAGAGPAIEELFVPELPVVLPAFQPNPLARDETKEAIGHIDVEFDVTKYGRGRDVEILDAANATRDAQDRLVRLIATSRFRPRPVAGTFDRASRVAVRYYLY